MSVEGQSFLDVIGWRFALVMLVQIEQLASLPFAYGNVMGRTLIQMLP
jgi:hypothetical protein